MKKILLLTLISFLLVPTLTSQNLRAYLTYSIFNTPENEPYVETYLTVNGASVVYKQLEDGNYQGVINVQVLFKKGDSIVNFAKYELNSPILKDTLNIEQNMMDIQRYGLANGEYDLEISLQDVYSGKEALSSFDVLTINFPDDKIDFSDIELLSSYEKTDAGGSLSKNGFLLTPYVFNYYPQSMNKVSFYSELYNTKDVLGDDAFLLTYYLRPFEVDKKIDKYIIRKRSTPSEVIVTLSSFDISDLPSGNYLLVMEARDRKNELLATKEVFFQRYNPSAEFNINNMLVLNPKNTFVGRMNSKDTLLTYIDYLTPISTDIERAYSKGLGQQTNIEELQKYFLNFWYERNSTNPEQEWVDYLARVHQANREFKSIKIAGYKTDRGRVFLQYGQPNIISDHHFEPAAYPYEIWHYYQLNGQNDKKFVFYAHDIATNDFQLIHSNAVGELNNYRWQTIVYRRTWDPPSIDDAVIPDTWGSKATQSYRQPW